MKKVLIILFVIVPLLSFSQADTVAHLYAFGGLENDNAEDIASTSDGGYIVVGSTSSNSSGNTDIYLLKVDSLCNREWSFALGGSNNDWGYAVQQTFDGGYIVAASTNSTSSGGYDAVLYKRDSLGNYVWTKHYGGQDWDFAYDVVQTYDSGFVFCGETYNNTNGYSDVYVVKTNNLGDTLWTKTIGGSLVDKGNAIIETSDSNLVVVGLKSSLLDSSDIYVLKINQVGGLVWDSVYSNSFYDVANCVIESTDGGFVVGGVKTNIVTGKDFYLMRINNDGFFVWGQDYSSDGDDEVFDLVEDVNGDLISVGHIEGFGGGLKDAFLFYVNSSGVWKGLGPTYGGFLNDGLKSIVKNGKGGYCLAGNTESFSNGNEDVLLIRVDSVVLGADTTIDMFLDMIPLDVLSQELSNKSVIIYPNPVVSSFGFKADKNIDLVLIFNELGVKVKNVNLNTSNIIDVSTLKTGWYSVLFYSDGHLVSTKLIIKT